MIQRSVKNSTLFKLISSLCLDNAFMQKGEKSTEDIQYTEIHYYESSKL